MQLGITKVQMFSALGSVTLGQRLLWATRHGVTRCDGKPWLVIIADGAGKRGVRTIVDARSVEEAWSRIREGEWPPELPSQVARRSEARRARN